MCFSVWSDFLSLPHERIRHLRQPICIGAFHHHAAGRLFSYLVLIAMLLTPLLGFRLRIKHSTIWEAFKRLGSLTPITVVGIWIFHGLGLANKNSRLRIITGWIES